MTSPHEDPKQKENLPIATRQSDRGTSAPGAITPMTTSEGLLKLKIVADPWLSGPVFGNCMLAWDTGRVWALRHWRLHGIRSRRVGHPVFEAVRSRVRQVHHRGNGDVLSNVVGRPGKCQTLNGKPKPGDLSCKAR